MSGMVEQVFISSATLGGRQIIVNVRDDISSARVKNEQSSVCYRQNTIH